MEHAAHVWYHERVDGLEAKGWTRTSVFMRRLVIDAQAVVIYMAVCVLIFVIDLFTQGTAERLASPPYRYFYAKSPRSWLCLVAHVVAHKDWAHLKTNMINLLLVGPAAEREFGTQQVAIVGVVVAVASALAHMAFGHSHSGQLGGSGVVSVCVETNQCVGCTRQFFTQSFRGDDAAVLVRSSGEEPESPRHRASVASIQHERAVKF